MKSHPLRMRGLKHFCTNKKSHPQYVASFADAWIETSRSGSVLEAVKSHPLRMRGLKLLSHLTGMCPVGSHPLRMRGLKLCLMNHDERRGVRRILCGCVD